MDEEILGKTEVEKLERTHGWDTEQLLISRKAKELLVDSNFFDIVIKELDKEVVGETPAREVIFLCMNGRLVENARNTSYNVLVTDETGAGKDHLCKSVGKLFEEDKIFIHRTRISPKVLDYWHTKKEEEWNWNGKILYLEDVSYDILNSDTMKTFLSAGSKTTILKDQTALDKEVKGKPIVIFTTSTTVPKSELLRRMNMLVLDTTINQTKEIAKRKCLEAKDGKIVEINPEIIIAMNILNRVKVKIPFADKLGKWIDTILEENIRVLFRTQIETFLDYIKAVTGIYQNQREKDEKGYLLATKQDYEIAKRCFEKMVSNPLMIPLTKEQIKTKELVKTFGNDDWVKITELIEKITWWEMANSYRQINKMVNLGIFDKDKEKYEGSDKFVGIIKVKELAPFKFPEFDML